MEPDDADKKKPEPLVVDIKTTSVAGSRPRGMDRGRLTMIVLALTPPRVHEALIALDDSVRAMGTALDKTLLPLQHMPREPLTTAEWPPQPDFTPFDAYVTRLSLGPPAEACDIEEPPRAFKKGSFFPAECVAGRKYNRPRRRR